MSGWTHVDRTARNRKGRFHRVDPHYNGRKAPDYWTCYVCRGRVLLNGLTVPIAVTPHDPPTRVRLSEISMSAQP